VEEVLNLNKKVFASSQDVFVAGTHSASGKLTTILDAREP